MRAAALLLCLGLAGAASAQTPDHPEAAGETTGGRFAPTGALLAGVHIPTRQGGLTRPDAALFEAELTATFWPGREGLLMLGASASAGLRAPPGAGRVTGNVFLGAATRDARFDAPWTRRGYAISLFGGAVDADGLPGWRAGLHAQLPFGGLYGLTGRSPGAILDGITGLNPGGCGSSKLSTAAAVIFIAFIAVIVLAAVAAMVNDLSLAVETVYPPGSPAATSMTVMLGFAY